MERYNGPWSVCSLSPASWLVQVMTRCVRLLTVTDPIIKIPIILEMVYPVAWLEEKAEGDPESRTNRELQTKVRTTTLSSYSNDDILLYLALPPSTPNNPSTNFHRLRLPNVSWSNAQCHPNPSSLYIIYYPQSDDCHG